MNNIHVLPTDKPSLLYLNIKSSQLCRSYSVTSQGGSVSNRHIYITSDEEIKEGYYLDLTHNIIMKSVFYPSSDKNCKKIILTTDQDLIKDGVQAIDDEFLECFVNNPSCEFVEVLFACRGLDGNTPIGEYKIIIPKEELHSMDDEVECNMCGGYMYLLPDNSIYVCTNSECTRCYEEEDEEPKQETTSEGFHRISKEIDYSEFDFVSFKIGIEWQQEQDKNKYSEVFEWLANKDYLSDKVELIQK
jgi:hypothetical protein